MDDDDDDETTPVAAVAVDVVAKVDSIMFGILLPCVAALRRMMVCPSNKARVVDVLLLLPIVMMMMMDK